MRRPASRPPELVLRATERIGDSEAMGNCLRWGAWDTSRRTPRLVARLWQLSKPQLNGGNVMRVHLVDGTFELFRHFYGGPPVTEASGNERGAVVGVIQTLLGMLEEGATHVGVATDHVIESFRNELYAGYKTGEGIDPLLREQFIPLEAAVAALGVVIW